MLKFLRSEESLLVYSNSQELLAVANLFQVKIHIFTYKGKDGSWSEIGPHPEMSSSAEFGNDWAPDLFLYHSLNNHYDLLVKDNSRLARIGLIGKAPEVTSINEWSTIKPSKSNQKSRSNVIEEEKLIKETEPSQIDAMEDIEEIVEVETLLKGKESGHRRTDPQTYAEKVLRKC